MKWRSTQSRSDSGRKRSCKKPARCVCRGKNSKPWSVLAEGLQFYRATLYVSAVFAVARCLSVCLTVCPICWCIVSGWLKISSNFFLRLVAPSFSFFWPLAPIPISKGNPFSGGTKYKGWENFAIFNWNRRLFRKRYEIGPWLLWNVNRNGDINDPDGPLTRFSRSQPFWSRISQKRCVLGTKLLHDTNRKQYPVYRMV